MVAGRRLIVATRPPGTIRGVRRANLGLSFLVELASFAALARAGAVLGSRIGSVAGAVVLAVVLPAVAIGVWARWNAPRSPHRLAARPRLASELAVHTAAVTLLTVAGAGDLGALLAVLVVVNTAGLLVLRQWEA